MLYKVFPFFAAQTVKNKAIAYERGFKRLRLISSNVKNPQQLFYFTGFASFMASLNDFGSEYLVELRKGKAPKDLNLTKKDQFFISSYVRLHRTE
jgi:hypothetical protein